MIQKKRQHQKGFTLVELLMATIILLPVFTLGAYTFIKCNDLINMAHHSSDAILAIKTKIAEIENTSYSTIYDTYNNGTFTESGLNASAGTISVDDSVTNQLEVTVSLSWQERAGYNMNEQLTTVISNI